MFYFLNQNNLSKRNMKKPEAIKWKCKAFILVFPKIDLECYKLSKKNTILHIWFVVIETQDEVCNCARIVHNLCSVC